MATSDGIPPDMTVKARKPTVKFKHAKELLKKVGIYSSEKSNRDDITGAERSASCEDLNRPIQRIRSVKKVQWMDKSTMKIRRVNSDRFTRRVKSENGSESSSQPRKSLPTLSTLSTSSGGGGDNSFVVVTKDDELLSPPKTEPKDSRSSSPTMTSKKNSNGHIDFFYPSVSKSRNETFHKLFQSVPEDEFPIDYFSCAFKGDILLQGSMYVSPNWICFYSKIKGRGRRVEIPFSDVICITREKTALVFPNAIGIQTANNKKVFGSFMSRDSTYRLLENLWKQANYPEKDSTLISSNDYRKSDKCSSLSDSSSYDEEDGTATGTTTENDFDHCLTCASVKMNSVTTGDKKTCVKCESNKLDQKSSQMERLPFFYFIKCIDSHEPYKSFCRLKVRLQQIPRTNLLLAICTILVFFLILSAAGLTYKILVIQAKIETAQTWSPQTKHTFREHMMGEAFTVKQESHNSIIHQLHSVIEANIHLLQEVHDSLRSLQAGFPGNLCKTKECP